MAANDEFPRGWDLVAGVASAGASLGVPAIPGITHVLTGITVLFWNPTGVTPAEIGVKVNGVVFGIIILATGTPDYSFGDYTWTGKLPITTGAALTLTTDGGPGFNINVEIQGYDI